MAAPPGNSNARKWTFEKTEELLSEIEKFSISIPVHFIGDALELAGVHKGVWATWKRIWADNDDIMDRIRLVDQRFENKIIAAAARRQFHAGICTLLLRSNYGHTEYKPSIAPSALPLPPPDLLSAVESEDCNSLCMRSRYATGMEYVIYSDEGDEVQTGSVTGDFQKIDISQLPDADYNILIRGPQNSHHRSIYIGRGEEEDNDDDDDVDEQTAALLRKTQNMSPEELYNDSVSRFKEKMGLTKDNPSEKPSP